MNINENQMLASFSEEFVKFRDEFLNLRNDDYRYERQSDLGEMQTKQNASITQHDNEIAAKKQEIADLATNTSLSDEEKQALQTRKEAELKNLEEAKRIDQEYMAEQENKYYDVKDNLRDKLKTLVADFKEKLGYNNVFGTQMSRIDVLKADINSRIVSISYQFETIRQQLYATKNSGDRKPLAVEMQKLIDERKRLVDLLEKLDTFEKTFANFERYLDTNDFVQDMDLSDFSSAFENVADAIVVDVDKTLISVDIITNDDGTYSLDMRCGNRVCDPRPVIPADKFNKNEVDSYLRGFANVLANKTKMTIDDLTSSNVILKSNGVNLGRHQFKNVGELSEKVRDGKKDEILAAVGMSDLDNQQQQQNQGDLDNQQQQQQNQGDLDNQQQQQNQGDLDNQQQQQQNQGDLDNQQQQQQNQGDLDNQQQQQQNQGNLDYGDDGYDYENRQNAQESSLPELDPHAMEVNSTRNARSKFFNKVNKTALLSAFGLGFAGPAIGIGMAGAIVASAIGVGSVGIESYYKIKENIKYGARVRQFKNLAKIMSEETGISIEFDMDLEKRKAGFKLEGSDRFLTSDDLRDPSIFPEGMDDVILDIFENGGKLNRFGKLSGMFAKRIKGVTTLNKYRGKGASAKTLKEERFSDFPLITFDNVSAAFNDFGGVKSRKELNDYQFDYNEIVQARKEEQAEESTLGENDDISYTDPNELENSLGDLNSEQILGQQDNGNSMSQGDDQQQNTQEQTPETPVPTPEQQENGNEQQEVEVVNPLSPSVQDPNVTQIQFPQDAQDQLKSELTDWIRSEVQDPTNGIAVADKLEEAIVGRKDELSEQSKIDLVNLFHDEVKFTEGQMERFDFICRHDRTLTDFEIKEAIAKLEQVRATQGETQLGMAVSAFLNEHSNLTKEDLETLHKFDTSKNLGFEEAINSKFNGQGPTR